MSASQMVPRIHLNGTSRESLLDGLLESARAVQIAIDTLARHCPNARDYYPISEAAFSQARAEHVDRIARLKSVYSELETIALALD